MKKPRVMIVDDAMYMRAVLNDLLKRNGIDVIGVAKNGLEGVELFKNLYDNQQTPDLIIMDINMKKMNGIEALVKIKKIDNTSKVIMCSSASNKEALVRSIEAGADYFIIKPFKNEEVIETINRTLKRRSKI